MKFKTISEMHLYRATKSKKTGDLWWARSVQAEGDGDDRYAFACRAKAKKYYTDAEAFRQLAMRDEGKTF